MTEDNSSEDVSFDWEKYKKDRVLLPGEQQQMTNDIKRKASFSPTPNEAKTENANNNPQ